MRRVKSVAELKIGETTEIEIERLEQDEQQGLAEAKRLTAEIRAQIVPPKCVACKRVLASRGHDTGTFWSLFGGVPIRVQRLPACQGTGEAMDFAAFDLKAATMAPEPTAYDCVCTREPKPTFAEGPLSQ